MRPLGRPEARCPQSKVHFSALGREEDVAIALPIDTPTAEQIVRAITRIHESTEFLLNLVTKDAAGRTTCSICEHEVLEFDPEPHSWDDEGNVCPVEILLAGIEGFTAHAERPTEALG